MDSGRKPRSDATLVLSNAANPLVLLRASARLCDKFHRAFAFSVKFNPARRNRPRATPMKNRYLTAFKEQFNLLGLGSAVALSAATLNPIPLLIGLVAEAAYLIFVPDTKWFEDRLSRRHDAEVREQREQLKREVLPKLRPSLQNRFARLEQERAEIDRQAADDKLWMREVLRKLDFLLDKFLQFALKDEQFRVYLFEERNEKLKDLGVRLPPEPTDAWARQTVVLLQNDYGSDISRVETQLERETDFNTRAVLQKRVEVLTRRRDFIARIGTIVANLSQQLALLEDTFGLISDELLARPPEQVLCDIEDVVSQTKTMTDVLEEMAPFERMLASS